MIKQRKIELLAPAKNLECGMAAVDHGADAVYIGAPRFGARAAAGNSLEDIAALVQYAHLYNVRIYVTVNTILRDEELKDTEEMIWELYRAGVDALIVQDMGLLELNLPPIPLHASTQMDNRTPEKAKFLAEAGFRQIVLARELSLPEIGKIHEAIPEVPLEVFVHGALCVSYSGQCYVSQSCFGRSANRGECAQFCRLAFDLVDADGKVIVRNKHLLSLKDLNQSEELEQLLDAGASSLKIEGRLKDISYVKNVTAYYRKKLDVVFKRRTEYIRASSGTVKTDFKPQLDKSFSRGFTNYFLFERNKDIFSFDTPKSLGEEMGTVKEIRGNYLTVAGVKSFNNGDGVCYLDENGKLQGFRINRVENNKLFPQEMPRIKPRTLLYRNFDQEFDRQMQRKSAERKLSVALVLAENNFGFTLTLTDEDDNSVSVVLERGKELARTPQTDNLRTQLGKLGNTPFEPARIDIDFSENWFIPASAIAELRRSGVEKLLEVRRINYRRELYKLPETHHSFPATELTYLGNVMNDRAYSFYQNHGVQRIAPAFEKVSADNAVLMFCKHCLRYSMGWCPTYHKVRSPYKEPYYLVSADGKRFRLEFDCKHCQMKVLSASDEPKLSSSHYQA
jgi:collagenase-like PrtC family protease